MSTGFPEEVFPLPYKGIDDEAFWDACNRREFVIQQCADCGELRHPPKPACPNCRSFDIDWKEVLGTGEVYTYTVTRSPVSQKSADIVPYNVSVVLLDGTDDIRFVTQLVEVDVDAIEIGMAVEVVWEPVTDEITLPLFRPVAE